MSRIRKIENLFKDGGNRMWIFDPNRCAYKFDKYAQEFLEILNKFSQGYQNKSMAYEDALNQYFYEKSFAWKPNQDEFLCSVEIERCFSLISHNLKGIYSGEDFICECLRQCFKKCIRWEE